MGVLQQPARVLFFPESIQLIIDAAQGHELIMCALLPEAAVVHDQNAISVADGGEPVSHDEGGMLPGHL